MKFELIPAERFEDEAAASWDKLNAARHNHVLLDSDFVSAAIRHFAGPRTLLCVTDSPGMGGMLFVEKRRFGFWQTFQPSQEPLGLALFENGKTAASQLSRLFPSLPGHALGLGVTQQDPDFAQFCDLPGTRSVEMLDYIETPRIKVRDSFDAFWAGTSKNLRQNLSRRGRRLKEKGIALELVEERSANEVVNAIEEYGRLEQSGWKMKSNTAVTADNVQGRFYRELFERFCDRGEGVIYRLLMNGKTVAADLCLQRNGMLIILKTAYDEAVRRQSPGFFLHHEIIKSIHERAETNSIEFYGPTREWHRHWTDETRRMYHANFYRYELVRTAHNRWRR